MGVGFLLPTNERYVMETFFPTSTPATIEELQDKVAQLERSAEIREGLLSKSLENNRQHEACVDNFMERLFSYLRDCEIDESIAEELANCFGRDLVRTVNVSITIHGEMEVNLPVGLTVDDLAEELDFGPNIHYATGIEVNYVDLSTVEIEEC